MRQPFRRGICFSIIAASFCTINSGMAQIAGNQKGISTRVAPPLGTPQVGGVTTGGMTFELQDSSEVVKNEPYQAQAVTEIKQTLSDGSHILQTNTATVARDSEGRTVRIQKLNTIGLWQSAAGSSQENGLTLTSIFDPVAKTHTDYTSDTKIAHVTTMPPTVPGGTATIAGNGVAVSFSGPMSTGGIGAAFRAQGGVALSQGSTGLETKTESLGSKTIEGIQVDGTRTTTKIPAGAIGNDRDIVITRETWYSPDLKLVLLSTQNDPRFGQTTYSLTNIQRSEPDPASLFQVPPGYKIVKIPVHPHAQ